MVSCWKASLQGQWIIRRLAIDQPKKMNDAKRLIDELVDRFLALGWKYDSMTPALRLVTSHPEAVADLADAVMERIPKDGTFLDAALLFLPENRWSEVVQNAVTRLTTDAKNDAAESVIAYASLHCPSAVHPFLADLFTIQERYRPYYGIYAWREAGDEAIDFLVRQFQEAPAAPPADAKRYRDVAVHLKCSPPGAPCGGRSHCASCRRGDIAHRPC